MSSWSEIEAETPELAALARPLFDAHGHKTLATLRRDGSPRISGTELVVAEGDFWLGSMWQARKALDLQRDPRYALHSGSDEPAAWRGDAKIAGTAEEITDPARIKAIIGKSAPPGPAHLFRLEITELVVVRIGEPADHIVVDSWREGRGVTRTRRS